MTFARSLLATVAVVLTTASCGADAGGGTPAALRTIQPEAELAVRTGGGEPARLQVAIADTDPERRRGLMGIRSLPEDHGMAFVWEEPVSATFWMKDTVLPLSIAFWDEEGRIVSILDMAPCEREPCRTYGPDRPFVGAVEANLGWFAERGVTVGDEVQLEVGSDG